MIFLREFYERLGTRSLGPEWNGSEVLSRETIFYDDALEIRSKLDNSLAELQSHHSDTLVDENFVKKLIEIDDETGVLRT